MSDFEREYRKLNAKQKQAVDTIDGPLLVIAGPGTGKTQLLSARVAQILKQTDTLPQNILCLTFTESGAANMRERLTRFIGQDAHNVSISTYHAFGGDLIKRFPEYFAETRMQDPIDEIGRHQILSSIIDKLSYLNPLKQTRHHLGDLIATISEVKRGLLTSDELRQIASENARFIQSASSSISRIMSDFSTMPRTLAKAEPVFSKILGILENLSNNLPEHGRYQPLANIATQSLRESLDDATSVEKTTPLTKWKNHWLVKNANNQFCMAGDLENKRIAALADVIDDYHKALEAKGLYDFDDMIIRSIQALETNPDLRFTLQEQYLYLLLDEFQDTNAAQLKLVALLSDNPVHEGRPNVMAVGDDDQAIYAFQGAQYSNMLDFYQLYRDTAVINLTKNYRSHADILLTAHNIVLQINDRLHHNFEKMDKTLEAANSSLPKEATLIRHDFMSDISQYHWIAKKIQKLIKSGIDPKDIAILAPKHRNLEPLVPYLNNVEIPVRYERRENILEAPITKQLLAMSRLVLAIQEGDNRLAKTLWPEVLSFDFWQLPIDVVWKTAWYVNDQKGQSGAWEQALLERQDTRHIALLFLGIAGRVNQETLESILDLLIGTEKLPTNDKQIPEVRSPLRNFYESNEYIQENPQLFYETLSHLKILREKLRNHQRHNTQTLILHDLLAFVDMYEAAGQQLLNTSPYNQAANSVQLMTVFKAKGLEYQHVFLIDVNDSVWGESSRGNANKLTLPPNLAPIRHAGASEDERLRILFVAITRARQGLYLTNYLHDYSGKSKPRLKYLDEQEQDNNVFKSMILPTKFQQIKTDNSTPPGIEHITLDWRSRHVDNSQVTNLQNLLRERVQNYRLSPTHLNTYTDVEYGGPRAFFYSTILRFPQAPSLAAQYGSAMHETMEWIQHQLDKTNNFPKLEDVLKEFSRKIEDKKLPEKQTKLEYERGAHALTAYLEQRGDGFKTGDKAEYNFWNEGVIIDDVHMSGKIDKLEIDHKNKSIVVVDYKTGKPSTSWKKEAKLHKYKQQLYCYKLLVEHSHTFAGYTVNSGRLEFLEPDENGKIQTLPLPFNDAEMQRIRNLLKAMWSHVMRLDFPDTSDYSHNLKGTLEFEDYLLGHNS